MTKQIKKPTSFGIWGNTDKPRFWELLNPILEWGVKNNLKPFLTTRINEKMKVEPIYQCEIIESADEFLNIDFIITLGGDGTMLSAARAVGHRNTPILGIHLGELGFMAEVTVNKMFDHLNMVAEGRYKIQNRMVLKAEVLNEDNSKEFYALNDFVVDRGKFHRIINIRLLANGQFVSDYKADGLILATPTGSTAYSLSVGGPVVMPQMKTIIVSPVSPHTLALRPIVLPDDLSLEIQFLEKSKSEIDFAVDGQVSEYLSPKTKIIVNKADFSTNMISFEGSSYFYTLRRKLGWGKRGNN